MAQRTVPDLNRIVEDPNIMVGKPVVRGTRIPVELVLGKFAADLDLEELFAAYPELDVEDVKAAIAYAGRRVEAEYRRTRRKPTQAAAGA